MSGHLWSWGGYTLLRLPPAWIAALALSIAIGGIAAGWGAAMADNRQISRATALAMVGGGITAAIGGTLLLTLMSLRMI